MTIGRYREKIDPVDAIQYTRESQEDVKVFLGDSDHGRNWNIDAGSNRLRIQGGSQGKADFGDWVARHGKRYFVIKDHDMKTLYEPYGEPKAAAAPPATPPATPATK